MKSEYDSLMKNDTWVLNTLPPDRKPIRCKWVYKFKENADGSINKYKARLVAKNFHQQLGLDYHETFYLIVKPTIIRIILTLALTNRWEVQQVDINNTFLNGELHEEVYIQPPPGFLDTCATLVFQLNKAIYGLKQAPHAWYEKLHQALLQFGFKPMWSLSL